MIALDELKLPKGLRSRRFSRQYDQALRAGSRGKAVDESEFINIIDHFILQRPLPGGRTVVETYVSAHPELAEADRVLRRRPHRRARAGGGITDERLPYLAHPPGA